ncbi:hypothetical protein R1flu_026966 [Riccia fluitans]|uniref:Uncharacterized protein n=1 Tax=Riccia fluitans TaxID=41844 RepID=A0ABD1XHF7_9MARC
MFLRGYMKLSKREEYIWAVEDEHNDFLWKMEQQGKNLKFPDSYIKCMKKNSEVDKLQTGVLRIRNLGFKKRKGFDFSLRRKRKTKRKLTRNGYRKRRRNDYVLRENSQKY